MKVELNTDRKHCAKEKKKEENAQNAKENKTETERDSRVCGRFAYGDVSFKKNKKQTNKPKKNH